MRDQMVRNLLFAGLLLILSCGSAVGDVIPSNNHIYIRVANDSGVQYPNWDYSYYNVDPPPLNVAYPTINLPGADPNAYFIKSDGGGQNELRISTTTSGGSITSFASTDPNPSGTFYITNNGGRGFDNDIILLVSVTGPIPDDFALHIDSSGYTWTPDTPGPYTPSTLGNVASAVHVAGLSETFAKSDFIYGPQVNRPGPSGWSNLYNGQNTADPSTAAYLMFIDLKVGNIFTSKAGLGGFSVDNGAARVQYSFSGLKSGSTVAFNVYGWVSASNQNEGINFTNDTTGGTNANGYSFTYTDITPPATTAIPAGGLFNSIQSVTLNASEAASIYYTSDGSQPSTGSTKYSGPIQISASTTLRYFAVDNSGNSETTKTAIYTIDTAPPATSASPVGGLFSSTQSVTLSASETASIYFTIDGSAPSTGSTKYSGPILISASTTLRYFAVDSAGNSEMAKTATYTIDTTPPLTTALPAGGIFNCAQNVTLSASETADVYYTSDGSLPSTGSTKYSGPILISANTTLKFFAVDSAGNSEMIKTAAYTIDTTPPVLTLNDVTSPASSTIQTIGGTNESGASVTVSLNGGSEIAATVAGTIWSFTISGLGYGSNGITVTATDPAGNSSVKSATIILNPRLTLTFTGSGGTVTSNPPGISCTDSCSATFEKGTTVKLIATRYSDYVFAGWSGCDSLLDGNCIFKLNADSSFAVTFNYVQPARIDNIQTDYYATLGDAYSAVTNGNTILAREFEFKEPLLTLDKNKIFTISGGYDSEYLSKAGYTTLQGVLTIVNGALTADLLIIK